MNVTSLSIFEESRFIIELALAIFPILFFLFKKKKDALIKFIPSIILIYLIAISYSFFYQYVISSNTFAGIVLFQVSWYMFLTTLMFLCSLFVFEISINDCLLIILGAYAIQHIDYVIINEMVRFIFMPDIANNLFLYGLLCLGATAILYIPYSYLFIKFKGDHSTILDSKKTTGFLLILILVILLSSSFFYQNYFRNHGEGDIQIVSSVGDLICTFLVVLAVLIIEKSSLDRRDKEVLEILYEKEKEQYDVFKGSIDYINIKFHDLKYEMGNLLNEGKISEESYKEIQNSLKAYEAKIDTGNSDIDVLLSDIALKCLNKNIPFSPLVDGRLLSKIEKYDLYVLFSNIFDNAILYQGKVEEKNRYINVVIKENNDMLIIKESNYLNDENDVIFNKDGSIKTSKASNTNDHGFGTKSMIKFAKKYKGTIKFSAKEHEFSVMLILPK